MANPIEAVVRSVLLAPRRQALLLPAAAPSVSECRSQHNRRNPPRVSFFACSAEHAPRLPSVGTRAMSSGSEYVEGRLAGENTSLQINMEREARIRKYLELENPEYLPSSYDTAWVAMVPLPGSYLRTPCFPQCVEWILQNQHGNGSWGVNEFDLSVNKDILLSTLACVIALKKWNVGSEQIRRGLQFIATNFSIVMDEQIAAPIGFHLTFPALVSLAIRMGLEFPATETSIDGILRLRDMELKSFWSQRDEEVMLDVATCAIAFRLLRMNGYDVSSDELSHVAEASTFHNSLEGYLDDTKSLLELYKASKVSLSENEPILEKIGCWSGSLLNEKLCSDAMQRIPIFGEVEYALKFPFYATVEPLDHKRNIEHFDARVSQKLKTKNLPCHFNQDLLALAVEDFSFSQSIYQDELQQLESWEKENKLDQLQFVRKNLTNSYLSAAATISPHELSDARVACAKSIALTLVADDFFDVGGSKEELENLISLVEKWDQHHKVEFYSEHVKVVFSAIYTTVNQLGAKASAVQNRDVTKYVVESWLDYLRSLATDAEWQRSKYVPTMEEYMTNSIATFALGPIILIALFFVGQNLWEDIVKDPEYNELFRLMSTCGRLQNDTQSFERECKDGKLNSVSLIVLHSGGSMSIEAAKKKILESIASYRRDLLRLVLREDSVIPRPCKEMFWRLYKTSHVFYSEADGFSSPKEMMGALNAVINEPLKLEATSPSLADQLKNNDSL
ncbi:9-beta-pimara-7,15-diene synthase, chloroplastic-like isoform X2 [Phragmites australis]|uniref:9-beta-pimara-7,15-diene synthase, chloroplastic-like isoform X2 n=1 Tax=Phragmites australis TaxID=29695 RepID=UPI002D7750D4|nr:9-beta-pimara-7,15-diene synthase, chloroplastic-like isoform X2 [Phragmites australis]